MKNETIHTPVMLDEVIDGLNIKPGGLYVDMTFGGGGYTKVIIEHGGKVVAVDRDEHAVARFNNKNEFAEDDLRLVVSPFSKIDEVLEALGITSVDGVVFDLGLSSDQLEDSSRGFSFSNDGPLDMRMGEDSVTAEDLLRGLTVQELTQLFRQYGEVRSAKYIAEKIKSGLESGEVHSTATLAEVIKNAYGYTWQKKIHPATQIFQALRIAVNDELHELEIGLSKVTPIIAKGGRLVVVSFHSLEDRIVKRYIQQREREGKMESISRKPIAASEKEIEQNPRARSAKTRIAKIL